MLCFQLAFENKTVIEGVGYRSAVHWEGEGFVGVMCMGSFYCSVMPRFSATPRPHSVTVDTA